MFGGQKKIGGGGISSLLEFAVILTILDVIFCGEKNSGNFLVLLAFPIFILNYSRRYKPA